MNRALDPTPAPQSAPRRALLGAKLAAPIIIGYLPVAFAFGIVGRLADLPDWATITMSVIVYGGASQFAALQLLSTGGLSAIISTTFIINSRHMLLSASLGPKLHRMNRWQKALFSLELTDEAYALHDAQYRSRPQRSRTEVFTANLLVHVSWVVGTILGVSFGHIVPNLDQLGLDFALTAMFIAILFTSVLKSAHDWLVAGLAGGIAVVVTLAGAGIWATVIAALTAATIGWIISMRRRRRTIGKAVSGSPQNTREAGA